MKIFNEVMAPKAQQLNKRTFVNSSDFLKCDCGYEICLISDCLGPESGLYSCIKGHIFCKNCADETLIKDIENCYPKRGYDAAKDFVKKKLCPVCKKEKGIRENLKIELLNADPNCNHIIVDSPGGGIHCKKCSGWFCF